MKLSNRLRRLERKAAHTYSPEEQREMLQAFIEIETLYNGRPLTDEEIAAEKQRLAQPIRKPKPKEIRVIAEEIKRIMNDRP